MPCKQEKDILSHNRNGCKEENASSKTWLIYSNDHLKNELTGQVLGKKHCNIKNVLFKKKDPKSWKPYLFYISWQPSTIFLLNKETGWATRVFKPILETRNVNDVCEHIWLLFLTWIICWLFVESVVFEF